MPRRFMRITLAFFVLGAVAASGITVGAILASSPTPGSLAEAAVITEVPVTSQDFNDERKVKVALEMSTSPSLISSAGGVITDSTCTPGSSFESTDSTFAIDGNPVLNLSTATPLWRDLQLGNTGADVAEVQAEFQRVGYPLAVDGVFGQSTLDAFRDALRQANHPSYLTAEFTLEAIQWIPAISTPVESCKLALGHRLSPGSDIATMPTEVSSASIVSIPTDLVPGARTLNIIGHAVDVDAEGGITAPEQLAMLATLLKQQQEQQPPGSELDGSAAGTQPAPAPELAATYALKDTTEVVAVPASAVTAIKVSTGCVIADDKPRKVTLVASELGKTLLTFSGEVPRMVSIDPPKDTRC